MAFLRYPAGCYLEAKMNSLKIPYALTQNKKIVNPQMANKDDKYFCPECNSNVTFRKGDKNQPHFAHKKDTECSAESVIHATAKKMIIRAWKNSANIIDPRHDPFSPCGVFMFRKCPKCDKGAYGNVLVGDISDIDDVKDEVGVGNYRVDVGFMSCGIPQYAIEVVHTHKVQSEKWDDFKKWKFPCVEVECQHVIDRWNLSLQDPPSFKRLFLEPIQNNFNNDSILEQRYRYDCKHCNPELFTIL